VLTVSIATRTQEHNMAYPLVNISNSTNFPATGVVSYPSGFCSNDDYSVGPNESWQASDRGGCLVNEITAVLQTSQGPVAATPYTSWPGTSYSQFAILKTGADSFAVTRITDPAEDHAPADYVEPTTAQK
jgi:hypothetical protein